MKTSQRALIACVALAFAATIEPGTESARAAASEQPVGWPLANEALLHSAHAWEARGRGDMARLALEKLVAARPDSPEALLELGELDLRVQDFAAARAVLERLQSRFAASASRASFDLEFRIATSGHLDFAAAARLLATGHAAEGRAALARLFPDGPPADALGIEYYQLWARTEHGWESARAGLARLAASHPGNPRYELAWAALSLQRPAFAAEAVAVLRGLALRDDVRIEEVDRLLAAGLRELGDAHAPPEAVREYLRRHPGDAVILAIQARQERTEEERQLASPDEWQLAIPVLQARLDRELAGADSQDPRTQASLRWLARSREGCRPRCAARAAAELNAAFALRWQRDEAVIPIARRLESEGIAAEAGELLATGAALDPQSSWLAETYARWLVDHDRPGDAIAWIRARAPQAPWTDGQPAALLAAALERRATSEENAGALAAAIEDLRAAIDARARDPWLRARLADLYAAAGSVERGRAILLAGIEVSPGDPTMRYALGLYLEHIGAEEDAYAAIDAVDPSHRTADMRALHDRLRVKLAIARARRLHTEGDEAGAVGALTGVDALAAEDLDRAVELSYAWIAIGDPEHGIALLAPYRARAGANDVGVLFKWAQVLDSAEDRERLRGALASLRVAAGLTAQDRRELARLQRDLDLRDIGASIRAHRYAEAARRLDELLRADPGDRVLRLARAQLYMTVGNPRAASDLYAALVAERPEDVATRLAYIRALLQCGSLGRARAQWQQIEEPIPPELAAAARQVREELDARSQAFESAGLLVRQQPGNAGTSQLNIAMIPNEWLLPLDSGPRITVRADAVTVDAGRLPRSYSQAALVGTIQAAGPGASERDVIGAESGVAPAVAYQDGTWRADLGTTPLGFVQSNVVGGVEWRPRWDDASLRLGLARRAVTNSELSYAGVRDPVTGAAWGAVVQSGPYAEIARYRETYGFSASLQASELTGTHVLDNRFLGAHAAANRQVFSVPFLRTELGVDTTYWNYAHNLANYTFGSGGYYSPQSYFSVALPVEMIGDRRAWSYRARVALSYSIAQNQGIAFYPDDATLQREAQAATLPAGYSTPYFPSSHTSAFGFTVYAAAERSITHGLILGGMIDIDRTDYYHPTTIFLYVRHGFGPHATDVNRPVEPLRQYLP